MNRFYLVEFISLLNPPQFFSSVLSPQSSNPSHSQSFGLQRPFLHLIWDALHSTETQRNLSAPFHWKHTINISFHYFLWLLGKKNIVFDIVFWCETTICGCNSRQLSSSLLSPQSFQPSHCRVWLIHRLSRHWNLPGQATQSHQTVTKLH